MSVRFSTGLRNGLLSSTGVKQAFTNGVLRIYSGVQPTSSDGVTSGTMLLEVTVDGLPFNHGSPTNGLNFGSPVDAVIAKEITENWQGSGLADGTAGWARLSGNPLDDGAASESLPRIDMSVAKTGGDLNLSNTGIVTGAPTTVDIFQLTMAES